MRQISLLIFCLLIWAPDSVWAHIAHLELGAANYGDEYGTSENQLKVLEDTFTDLITAYGPRGVIYINDIDPRGVDLTVKHMNKWLAEKGISEIQLIALPGDYNKILIPDVTSAHLSNPGRDQLPSALATRTSNKNTVSHLERIASHSKTGLKITTYFHNGPKNPINLLQKYSSNFVIEFVEDSGYEYFTPEGEYWRAAYSNNRVTIGSKTHTYIFRKPKNLCEKWVAKILF